MAIKRKNTGGALFEQAISMLEVAGFYRVHWKEARDTMFDKVIVEHYPYKTIYGTRGRHEWAIITRSSSCFIECKFQDGGGSVDEKLPYMLESFKSSTAWQPYPLIKNWIIAFEGPYWRKGRGAAGVEWLKGRAAKFSSSRKTLVITNTMNELSSELTKRFT